MPRLFKAHIHEYGPRLTTKELVYVGAELGKVLTLSFERKPKMHTDDYLFFKIQCSYTSQAQLKKYIIDKNKRWQEGRFLH